MGFTSLDDFIDKISNDGQIYRADWNKNAFGTTAQAAGVWYCMLRGGGSPAADTLLGTGTNKAFQALTDATTDIQCIRHGDNVTPATKHVVNASAFSAAGTSMPAVMMFVDILGFYPITTVTTTGAQTLDNTITLPRYTDGKGVQAFLTPSTAMGAGTPTVTLNYTNSEGTASRTTPTSPSLPICNTTSPITQISYSGTGVGKFGPFIPLATGDAGIRSVQSISFSATMTSGVQNLVLCRPLFTMPMTTIGVVSERDFLNQVPSLPRVYDGAVIMPLMYAGANTPTNSAYYGHIDFAWS